MTMGAKTSTSSIAGRSPTFARGPMTAAATMPKPTTVATVGATGHIPKP